MKTIQDVKAYLSNMETTADQKGPYGVSAEPGDSHEELFALKETIRLDQCQANVESCNIEEVLEKYNGHLGDWATWTVRFDGLGLVYLHLYDLSEPGDAHTWAEFWFEGEPFWEGDEPFECSWEQIAATVQSLPEAHRNRYLEFAVKGDDLRERMVEHGLISAAPSP